MDISARPDTAARRIDVNTDDLQKIVLSTSEKAKDEVKENTTAKAKETTRTPIQLIIQGNDKDAKKNMLGDFLQKIATAGMDIMTSPDKGQKDTKSINEIKLLFGNEESKEDKVSLSSGARMSQLAGSIAPKKGDKKKIDSETSSEETLADKEEELQEHVFSEKTNVRDQIQKFQDDSDSAAKAKEGEVQDSGDFSDFLEELGKDKNDEDNDLEPEAESGDSALSSDSEDDSPLSSTKQDIKGQTDNQTNFLSGSDNPLQNDTDSQNTDKPEEDGEDEDKIKTNEDKTEKSSGLNSSQRVTGFNNDDANDTSDERPKDQTEDTDNISVKDIKKIIADNAPDKLADSDLSTENDDSKDKDDDTPDANDVDDKKDGKDNDVEQAFGGRIEMDDTNDGGDDNGKHDTREELKIEDIKTKTKGKEQEVDKFDYIEEYTEKYRKHLLSSDKNFFDLSQDENKLLKEYGLTSRQIKDIQLTVKKTIKTEIRENIKDAIIQKQLSVQSKIDSVTADTRLNRFTEYFVSNILLGGQDFGSFDESFQGLINKAMYHAGKELSDFAIDELGHFVMDESLKSDKTKEQKIKSFESKVSELNSITNNPKITEEWAQTAMESFMRNYGLAKEEINLHKNDTAGMHVNINTGDGGFNRQDDRGRQKHGYEFEQKDEKDIFINRLRALYMQRALEPGLTTTLQTEFKIRKLKNGLLKLGVYTEVLNKKIEEEAKMIAQDRIKDMLKEAFYERASLYELRGPAYELIENKIKGILKNGEKAGLKMDKLEFDKMRDEINMKMFETTKHEMEMIAARLSDMELPALVVKYREMKKITDRLKAESNIEEEISGDERLSKITVTEMA
ncbi:MAG: hypothetical protein PHV30_08820 [Candidatus Margulisbacteria bacterium]|nr:hypothetical protein [Candidatus Margulisiibacteriota bacterium]